MKVNQNQSKKEAGPQAAKAQAKINTLTRELAQSRKDIKIMKARPEFIRKTPLGQKNPYLASILDPEGTQGVRYPDGFCQRTAMVPGLVNQPIPYFPSTSTVEPPGSFNFIVRPSAVHPVWVYGKQKSAITSYDGFVDEQDTYGLFPLSDSEPGISQQVGNMILQSGVTNNVKYVMTFQQNDWQQDPYKAVDQSGNYFYGQPMSGFSVVPNVQASIVCDGMGIAVNDTVKFDFVDAAGHTATATATATVVGQTKFEVGPVSLSSFFATDADPEILKAMARPGFGVRLTATLANQHSISVNSFHIYTIGGTHSAAKYALYPMDLEDQDKFLNAVDLYRVVSQSALLTYMGATLTDGGQISSLQYLGGEHPHELNFWNYTGIAQAVNSPHNGPLKRGTYVIWKPKDTQDMVMRPTVNATDWEHPYIVVAGVVSSPDILNTLRLRMFANYEVVSKSMFLKQSYGEDAPGKIRQAMSILRTFPLAGENDTHLDSIKRILGQAWDATKNTIQWGVDNKGWIVPVATAVASLL